jgi:hypothetical protein
MSAAAIDRRLREASDLAGSLHPNARLDTSRPFSNPRRCACTWLAGFADRVAESHLQRGALMAVLALERIAGTTRA